MKKNPFKVFAQEMRKDANMCVETARVWWEINTWMGRTLMAVPLFILMGGTFILTALVLLVELAEHIPGMRHSCKTHKRTQK